VIEVSGSVVTFLLEAPTTASWLFRLFPSLVHSRFHSWHASGSRVFASVCGECGECGNVLMRLLRVVAPAEMTMTWLLSGTQVFKYKGEVTLIHVHDQAGVGCYAGRLI
jgi:hypothetical protein